MLIKITNNETAKNTAIELYRSIEEHSFDIKWLLEVFTRDWQSMEDLA